MFGFIVKSEVNDDAVRLKMVIDRSLSKYGNLSADELKIRIEKDYPPPSSYIGDREINFTTPDADNFLFSFDLFREPFSFSAHGRGKYAGFMLIASDGRFSCSASDGLTYSATGGAKTLAKTMVKKYGALDIDKALKRRF